MSSSSEEEDGLDLEQISNGLVLSNIFLPEEVLLNIMVFVDWKDLMSCRLVCQSWRRIIDSVVCFEKLKLLSFKTLNDSFSGPISQVTSHSVPFYLYFGVSIGAFGKNLLKNPFGSGDDPHVCQPDRHYLMTLSLRNTRYFNNRLCSQNDCPKYKHWGVLESKGNGWAVEAEPLGSEPLPAHLPGRSCFVTSFGWCRKEQIITLAEHGLNSKIMDHIQPQFEISEWYARRWDCGMLYTLHVSLLDSNKEILHMFEVEDGKNLVDNQWHEVSHTFKDYGPGVRYILFAHGGIDSQFWAGHYGSKMAGGSVIARIPVSRFERKI